MRKYCYLVLTIVICFALSIQGVNAKELTLNQLEAQAKANRDAYNKAKEQKALTETERAQATKQKAEVENEIKSIDAELKTIEADITKLQESMKVKDKEIKELMKFVIRFWCKLIYRFYLSCFCSRTIIKL